MYTLTRKALTLVSGGILQLFAEQAATIVESFILKFVGNPRFSVLHVPCGESFLCSSVFVLPARFVCIRMDALMEISGYCIMGRIGKLGFLRASL